MPFAASPVTARVTKIPLNIVFLTVFIPLLLLRSGKAPSNLVPAKEGLELNC
jgi:hypothetical protein